ncbi:MAG: peptidase domain protein [Bryobacterales bacterium]|nr:peptidase domain protein [Bryobacterales bacterium]
MKNPGTAVNLVGGVFILAAALTAQTPSYKLLHYPALPELKLPHIESFTLPNGMQLYLLENHELPLVRGVALVRTGNLFDPPEKVGLATITGEVLRTGGTKSKTGDQLDEQLENLAASVETNIGESYGTASFSALKENTDEVLGVFKEVLTHPEFRQEKIDLSKDQIRSGISRRNDDPGGIAAREFASLLYGKDTPYGWNIEYATVDRIQRADLIDFYDRYFFPANIMLAATGDFSAPELRAKLEKLFADWTVRKPKVPPFPPVRKEAEPGVFLVTKTDVTQTTFRLGHLGSTLDDKDYPALQVMADILGSGFQSRLMQTVRTKLGYAYEISANWGANFDHPGLFEIGGSTKSANTVDAIKVSEQELEKMRTSEVTPDELETAKQAVMNSFVFNFDTPVKTLNRLLLYKYFDYPDDFLFRYQKAVAAVTRADVLRVAKERVNPKVLTVLAVGNPKDFGKPLSALGMPVKELDISIPEPKKETSQASAETLAAGKLLLQKVQEASGGAGKLAAIKDVSQHQQMQVAPTGGGLKADQWNRWIAPGTFRQDAKYPFGNVAVYFNGKSGWIVTPQGGGDLPPAQQKQVEGELFRLYIPLLLSDRNPDRKVNLAGDGVLEISDSSGNSVRITIDPKTGLPAKEEYQTLQSQGPPTATTQEFTAFHTVNGVQLPAKIAILQNGKPFAEVTVADAAINAGLKPEELSKKP